MGPPGSEALFGPTGRSRGDARPPFPNPIPNGHKDGSARTALYKSQLAVTHRETDPLPFPLPASPKISAPSLVPAQLTLLPPPPHPSRTHAQQQQPPMSIAAARSPSPGPAARPCCGGGGGLRRSADSSPFRPAASPAPGKPARLPSFPRRD
jgi:hypothetical protein